MVSESRLRTLRKLENLREGDSLKIKFKTGEYVPAFYRGKTEDSNGPVLNYSEGSPESVVRSTHFYSMIYADFEGQSRGLMFRSFKEPRSDNKNK